MLAALAAPAIVGGFLVALPLLDKRPERAIRARMPWLGALAGMLALIAALTVSSFARDAGDEALAKRRTEAARAAHHARYLARTYGVPATGPADMWTLAPMAKARRLYETRCKNCHDEASKDRKGPVIGPGHGNRAWFAAFLKDPSNDRFWGRTKLAKREEAMQPVELPQADIDALAELLYAESGATDIDAAKRERGAQLFETSCNDCHSREDGVAGSGGPNLHALGSRDQLTHFIGNPKSPIHMGSDFSEMPRFDQELTLVERDAIAEYLVWLRTATAADLGRLGPP
jgi:mono/diheme cytochrome c family protein